MPTQYDIPTMGTPIDQLMDKHDMSRDEAEEIVDELQGDSDDPIICAKCGQVEDREEGIAVERYVLPDGSKATLDNECYAEIIEEETTLAKRQSEVVAMLVAGFTYSEVGEITGGGSGAVSQHRSLALEKATEAPEQIEKLYGTMEVVAQLMDVAER